MSSKKNQASQISKMQPVMRFLDENYNRPLTLKEVASHANLSPYYFHRIFKSLVGEPLNQYLRRLKLEHAANQLFYQQAAVTHVALDVGFSSAQALSKALNSHFGLNAKQIKQCKDVETFKQLIEKSKIGHQLSNFGHANTNESVHNQAGVLSDEFIMSTETMAEQELIGLRITGAYNNKEGQVEEAVQSLYELAELNGIERKAVQVLFLYQDNPQLTPANRCRMDICIKLKTNEPSSKLQAPSPFKTLMLNANQYAVYRAKISDGSEYAQAWHKLLSGVVNSNWMVNGFPMVQKFHSFNREDHIADVSFYAPIKPA